jgi:FtsZ-binding cell division protein ZapB
MKHQNINRLFWSDMLKAVVIIALGIFVSVLASSCKSSKNILTQKESFDSTSINEMKQEIRMLRLENQNLQERINEMDLFGVQFDNDCDSVIRAVLNRSGCNTDSINAVISALKASVKINPDGSMEVQGLIKSLTREKKRNEERISNMQKSIDSLASIEQKTQHWVRTVTITKHTIKKRSFLTQWWLWVIFLAGGFVIGFRVCWVYKDRIKDHIGRMDNGNAT